MTDLTGFGKLAGLLAVIVALSATPAVALDSEWTHWGGDAASTRYSPHDQIDASNFEDLEVAGIVFNSEVGSVAVIADRMSERRFRLREGERVGTARVVEIRPDEVVFAISTFGANRQAVLRVKKEREQEE